MCAIVHVEGWVGVLVGGCYFSANIPSSFRVLTMFSRVVFSSDGPMAVCMRMICVASSSVELVAWVWCCSFSERSSAMSSRLAMSRASLSWRFVFSVRIFVATSRVSLLMCTILSERFAGCKGVFLL